ncbi:MAG: type II secretion system F family protein [Myxococcales bacterium]
MSLGSLPAFIPSADLETLLTLFAQTLEAGATLRICIAGGALSSLRPDVAARFEHAIDKGTPLSEAFAGLLDKSCVAFLRAAEDSGGLPATLRQVALILEERRRDRNAFLGSLVYPGVLVVTALLVLPLPVAVAEGLGAYAVRVVPGLLVVLATAFGLVIVLPRVPLDSPAGQVLASIRGALPFLGAAMWDTALGIFAAVLGEALRSGLPVRRALALAAEAAPHRVFTGTAPMLVARIDRGSTLAEAIGQIGKIPRSFLAQVGQGELTGTLDQVLPRLAREHKDRARRSQVLALGAFAALLFVLIGGLLAYSIISSWAQLFERQQQEIDRIMHP